MKSIQKEKNRRRGRAPRKLRRGLALLLAVIMMVPSQLPGLSFTSHAEGDLTPVTLPNNGGGLATAYAIKDNGSFDVAGIQDPSLIGSDTPYVTDRRRAIGTTYNMGGYYTYIRPYDGTTPPAGTMGAEPQIKIGKNGDVSTVIGLQVQIKVSPTQDGKWIMVEYNIHNPSATETKEVQMVTRADIRLGGDYNDDRPDHSDAADSSKLIINDRGFHMVNKETQQTLELMFNYPGLNLTKPDWAWVGNQLDRKANSYTDWDHTKPEQKEVENTDSALAYSWNMRLAPNQTETKRVAFGVKGPSYYVNADGRDQADGTYADPCKTFDAALQKIQNNKVVQQNQDSAVFIYLQSPYTIDQTVHIPAKCNVGILSTDYNKAGYPVNNIYTITRAPTMKSGPMFSTSVGGVRFGDVVLDGNKGAVGSSGPIISASGGSVGLTSGAVLKNNKVADAGTGSAIHITGSTKLDLDSGTITGNETVDTGAINFNGTGRFAAAGSINITGNTNAAGKPANVYLPTGKLIRVKDTLSPSGTAASRIGITSERLPDASPHGVPSMAGQEVKVAAPVANSSVQVSAGNFTADQSEQYGQLRLQQGTAYEGADPDNTNSAVLTQYGYIMKFKVSTKTGDPQIPLPAVPKIADLFFLPGSPVDTPQAPNVAGYKLDQTQIAPPDGLQAAGPNSATPGKVTGTMPRMDVTVFYTYRQLKAQIAFVLNGGTTPDGLTEIPVMSGPTGSDVPPQPTVSKPGYDFLGWSEQNAGPDSPLFTWPDKFAQDEITLYAVFKPNTSDQFEYTAEYYDKTNNILLKEEHEEYPVNTQLTKKALTIPGYNFVPGDSSFTPEKYIYNPAVGEASVGKFVEGTFSGMMPAEPLKVHFSYSPDPNKTFPLTVHYVSRGGTDLQEPVQESLLAGTPVHIGPETFPGYTFSEAAVNKGADAHQLPDGSWLTGMTNPPTNENGWVWDDKMPNQEVELTYTYEKDPDQWMDIHFTAEHADLTSPASTETLNVQIGSKWGMISADQLPVYSPWNYYTEDGWYTKDAAGHYTPVTPQTTLQSGETYIHRFTPDPAHKFDYTVQYTNGDGSVVFKTVTAAASHKIEDEVTAEAEIVPGYTYNKAASDTTPADYAFDPHGAPTPIGTFEDNGHFSGRMPGEALTVNYRYSMDPNQTFNLTVNYQTVNGIQVAPSTGPVAYHAGDPITSAPEVKEGYKYDHFQFEAGKTAIGNQQPAVGQPGANGSWSSVMPNQDVVLTYYYTGDPAKTYTVTEVYTGTGRDGYQVEPISSTVVKEVPADTLVSGAYEQPHGYRFKSSKIEFDPAAPEGNDLQLGADGKTWSGHMPAANVTITYTNDRIPDNWVTITYKTGNNGKIYKLSGMSGSLLQVPGTSGNDAQYYIDILKDDGSGSPAIPNWQKMTDNKMIPSAAALDTTLYKFEGWFEDTSGDGDRQEDEPLLEGSRTFTADTTLTASFIKDDRNWITILLAAKNGNLAPGSPSSLNVPRTAHWKDIMGQLPDYIPWPNYKKVGWRDAGNFPLGDGTGGTQNPQLQSGATYTAVSEPDPASTFPFTVKYTNANESITFREADGGSYKIEDQPAAQKMDIPGYVWDSSTGSRADPAEYNFDRNNPAVMESTGSFNPTDGSFTGKMPGAPLTVYYHYKPVPNPDPDRDQFKLTVKFRSENGAVLKEDDVSTLSPETGFTRIGPVIPNYTCDHYTKDTGWTANPDAGIQAITSEPVKQADGSYTWTGTMPNQDVTLTFYYKGNQGDQAQKFSITERYMDVTDDPANPRLITASVRENIPADTPVEGLYTQPYGYTAQPPFTIELADAAVMNNLAFGKDGDPNKWGGPMPASNVTVTYNNTRNLQPQDQNWATMTYQKTAHGSLTTTGDTSPEVTTADGGATYTVPILVSDGTAAGDAGAYRWSDLKAKHLIPTASPDLYYTFEGWYIDANENGAVDTGEAFLGKGDADDTAQANGTWFSGNTKLVASFVETQGAWIDITFQAEKGSLAPNSNPEALHIQADKTWGDIQSQLPTYEPWSGYKKDAWYEQLPGSTDLTPLTEGSPLHDGTVYMERFIPNENVQHNFVTVYQSDSGLIFSTNEADPPKFSIEDTVTAEPKTIPGYNLNQGDGGTTTDPLSYEFTPGTPTLFSTYFDPYMRFSGMMPGEDLKVIYKYTPSTTYQFELKILYQSENGNTLADSYSELHTPEDRFEVAPASIPGYTCSGFEITAGNQATDTATAVQGTPDAGNGYRWISHMPNQNVTLIYRYQGSPGESHRYTQRYIDSKTADAGLSLLKTDVSEPTAPDTPINGQYQSLYGYSKLSSEITYNPENPAGADLHFTDDAQTVWTGHMPAAEVGITYTLDRIGQKWVPVTYQAGLHGSLNADGKSGDLQAVTGGAPGVQYSADVLKEDGTDPLNQPYNWGMIQAKGLSPNTVPDDSMLYFFEGWFIDTSGDRIRQDDEPILENTKTFDAATMLTASFKENTGAWIDIQFAAEKGDLGQINPEIIHIPDGTTWGGIKEKLPVCTPWTNYRFEGWYDGNSAMTDDTVLLNGHTYTARCVSDDAYTNACQVIYTNLDDTVTFGTTDLGLKKIEDPVNAVKIDVPGYIWSREDSAAEPPSYIDGAGQTITTGDFDADGAFTGKMPGEALTVHYRYKINPNPPSQETFNVTIRYESVRGTTLADPKTMEHVAPETEIHETPLDFAHYTCIGADLIKGFTADGSKQPAAAPSATAPYAWDTRMPNQDVELVYRYQGQSGDDPANQFVVVENYMDVTNPDRPSLISTETSYPITVDDIVHGRYTQPYGYDPADFKIQIDTEGVMASLAFGYDGDPNQWGGPMPASNVTVTYNNIRHTDPTPENPSEGNWAPLTYQRTDHGTLSRDAQTQPDLTEVTPGSEYTAQMLVTDGSAQGNAAAYKWSDLKAKDLVPAAAEDPYYQFDGWYLDNGDGVLDKDTDTLLGKGDDTDTETANNTIFNGAATLFASFSEIPDQWIDINFNAENGTLQSGAETMHIQSDRLWGNIKNNVPVYTAWPHYTDDGWYAGDVKVMDGDHLIGGQTYTHRFIPSTAPEDTYTVTKLYTNSDGSIVFKTDTSDTTAYHITDPVTAEKIDVPGYVWNKDASTTDPAMYPFDPAVGGTPVGSFDDNGIFTGRMPGGMADKTLKIIYRYDVAPTPPDPEQYPFHLTIRYESRNGGVLHEPVLDRPMNANDPIHETPVAVDHYDCDGYRFVKGDQAVGNAQPVAAVPDAAHGYAWDTVMPNQDVELIYLYRGQGGETSQFRLTETYMDVTDPANPRIISSSTEDGIPVDEVKNGQYIQPYGYDPAQKEDGSGPDFTVTLETPGIQTSLAFGADGDSNKWSGPMPASNVTITYNNIRHTNPENPDDPQDHWADMTYKRTANGTLIPPASTEVTETTPGAEYTVPILVTDGTEAGNAGAYKWSDLKAKGLLPTPQADQLYTFTGWYQDNGDGSFDKATDTLIGMGDDRDTPAVNNTIFTGATTLFASFEETQGAWMDIHFATKNSTLLGTIDHELEHIPVGTTWGELQNLGGHQLPDFEAWPHYTKYGWCLGDGDQLMQDSDILTDRATYTAVSKPSETDTFACTVQYENAGGLVFRTEPVTQHKIDDTVTAAAVTLPGYEYDKEDSFTTPAEYGFDQANPDQMTQIGTFEDDGSFHGRMPGEALTVHYRYKVKTNPDPGQDLYTLTVRYYSKNGARLHDDTVIHGLAAETEIHQPSLPIPHYTCNDYTKDTGWDADPAAGIQSVQIDPVAVQAPGTGYTWDARMPNQDVTLTYLYEGNQDDPASMFSYTENYMDVTNPDEPRLISTNTENSIPVDREVHGAYTQPYGYDPALKADEATYDFTITLDDTVQTNLAFGYQGDPNQWGGVMPAANVTVTYNNTRQVNPDDPADPENKWATLTYKRTDHGTLSKDAQNQPDLTEVTPGSEYTAQTLITDGTEQGDAAAYKWSDLKAKGLVPAAAEDTYYQFDGWYLDNGDGVFDKGTDTLLGKGDNTDTDAANNTIFSSAATLFASFSEKNDDWINISFSAEKGTLDSTGKPEQLHIQSDKTWGDIQTELPTYTAWESYQDGGWYEQLTEGAPLTAMQTDSPLHGDAVYIHKFVPITDPGDTAHTYTYTKSYVSETGIHLIPDVTDTPKYIDDPVAAAPETIPGYTLVQDGWSINPPTWAYDGVNQEEFGSFDGQGNFTGRMPGHDLTVTYTYKPTDVTYTLSVQHLSQKGVPLTQVPNQNLKAEETFTTEPQHFDGYRCTSAEILQRTDQAGVTWVQGTPATDAPFTAAMPNQSITVVYRYTGSTSEADRHTLTVRYLDTGSEDPALSELSVTTADYLPDEAIADGTFQAPAGYRRDPEQGITIEPANRGIRFTDESQTGWTGFMPAEDVTITCYCQRLPYDPANPDNYWGDLTYEPGTHGTLSKDGTTDWPVSADVTAAGNGAYTAGILLNNAAMDRPEAYTWGMIQDKQLVPRPEADEYYQFEGWFEDTNPKNGIRDENEPLIPDGAARTFTGPATLTASFAEDASWITLSFAAENGTLAAPDQTIHIPAGRDTWGQILQQVTCEPWAGYTFDRWADPDGNTMNETMPVVTGGTYTVHYIPDPNATHSYTLQYISDDGVVTRREPEQQLKIMDPINAEKREMQGYHWVEGDSGTTPAAYPFDPTAPAAPIGSFDGNGAFSGHMPGENLTLTYSYSKDPDAAYPLTVISKLVNPDTGAATVIRTDPMGAVAPGTEKTLTPPTLDGFLYNKSFEIQDGLADETANGTITEPVKGHPDENGSWTFRMPNQAVTLIYYYKVDESKQYSITERYLDTEAAEGHQDIMEPVVKQYRAGAPVDGTYPDLYGYDKAGLTDHDIKLDQPWTGAGITVNGDGSGWSGTMPPRTVTITYRYTRTGYDPDDPNPPDPGENHPWGDLYYLPSANGSISKTGQSPDIKNYHRDTAPDGTPRPEDGYKTSILFDNGSTAPTNRPYTFGDIKNKGLLPNAAADPYYTFYGWFVDANDNGVPDEGETRFSRDPGEGDHYDQTFAIESTLGQKTLRPIFGETPGQWYDIFLQGENTTTDGANRTTLHIQYDKKWGELGPDGLNLLPGYAGLPNYVAGDWYDTTDPSNYIKMEAASGLANGHIYTYIFKQDPAVFGTDVSTPEASAGLNGLGRGIITLYDTNKETTNYDYVLTDLNGTIQQVFSRLSRSQRVEFDGLQPEGRYQVYEALPEVQARPGGNIQDLGPIGGDEPKISEPTEVLIPVLTDNYQVYYSDVTGEDTSTRLAIRPADAESEYAVLDGNGNPVTAPGAAEGGWMSLPSGGSTIQIPGLVYGADYTVVARPKGRTDITTEDQREDGTVITADPVGALNLKTYILKTTAGEIVTVGGTEVEDIYYAGPIEGQAVTLSAPGSNGEGDFVKWEVTIGSPEDLKNLSGGRLTAGDYANPDLTFLMPKENLVMTPIYEHDPHPNAAVTDEVRGGNKNEIALDPNQIPGMESSLTQEKDLELWNDNRAEVTYKVIYKKGGVKANESDWIKKFEFPQGHLDAYHAAWGLDISVERYVNGRNVALPATSSDAQQAEAATPADAAAAANTTPAADDAAANTTPSADAAAASPSNATVETVQFDNAPPSYLTYIQLSKGDVDMLDYQLYEIKTNGSGEIESATPVALIPVKSLDQMTPEEHADGDVAEQDGGLFAFEATVGSRYVMVYSRAYHLYFANEVQLPPFKDNPVYYDFKVRRNESPNNGIYSDWYSQIPVPEEEDAHLIRNETGAEYIYQGWSYDRDKTDHPRMFDPSRPIKNTTKVYAYYSDNEKQVAEERRLLDQTIKEAEKLSRSPFLKRQDSEKLKGEIGKAQGVLNQEDPRRSLEAELRKAREDLLKAMKFYQDLIEAAQNAYDEMQNSHSGGGGSGGGGGGSGIKSDPYTPEPARNYVVGNNGDWKLLSSEPGQPKQWAFVIHGGMMLRSTWAYLSYPDVTNAATGWYHFNSNAIMDTGWYTDEKGKWYYGYKEGEGPEGKMATGWHLDAADGNWYYLDPVNGDMTTGWRQIGGKWYYMETVGRSGAATHPLGAMYKNEQTPDGYTVDANGARIQ